MSLTRSGRVGEVLARLDRVQDPELDESVTSLGFVTGVSVSDDGRVEIGFRLPTYWCAANFAFLMADDMRTEVGRLPWVSGVGVVLGEHMYAETINAAMQRGQSFQEAFAAEADGDLDSGVELRHRAGLLGQSDRVERCVELVAVDLGGCCGVGLAALHVCLPGK